MSVVAIPKSERESNEKKNLVDRAVESFIGMGKNFARQTAEEVILKLKDPYKIVVCGGAGSTKTTFSEALGDVLDIPTFDLDMYIPGGWTPNKKDYEHAFAEGLNNVWDDLPLAKSWIIEHIEASGPAVRDLFKPKWAIHLHFGQEQLKLVAMLRDAVSGESEGARELRALSSNKLSFDQFTKAPGKVIAEGYGWSLKELE